MVALVLLVLWAAATSADTEQLWLPRALAMRAPRRATESPSATMLRYDVRNITSGAYYAGVDVAPEAFV